MQTRCLNSLGWFKLHCNKAKINYPRCLNEDTMGILMEEGKHVYTFVPVLYNGHCVMKGDTLRW